MLTTELSRHILRRVWKRVQKQHPFVVDAVCLLPDHLHCMWTLPDDDSDYSLRWNSIKGLFIKEYLKSGAQDGIRNDSRAKSEAVATTDFGVLSKRKNNLHHQKNRLYLDQYKDLNIGINDETN